MQVEPGDIGVGLMMTSFGFAGLFLAAGARDDAMYVFGLSLVAFAFVFVLGLVKRHYDRAAAPAPAVAAAFAAPTPAFAYAPASVAAPQRAKVPAHV